MTGGGDLLALPVDVFYNVAVALFARAAAQDPGVQENIDASLDTLGPPKSERTGGIDSYDPDLEIPGWGTADLPDFVRAMGPADGSDRI